MIDPYEHVRLFERHLCEYAGAPYAVTVNSCSMALQLCCQYCSVGTVSIPKFTYNSLPMVIRHAGGRVVFDDRKWSGAYSLDPYPIVDSARRFTSGMYSTGYVCVSFHYTKILALTHGGAILHGDEEADGWFRRARFDGRREKVAPKDDHFDFLGHHCLVYPDWAGHGSMKLSVLPKHNADLPPSDYKDLSLDDWNAMK